MLESPWEPRILRLCGSYKLNEKETDLFHLLAVIQGSTDGHVINALLEDDFQRRVIAMMRIIQMSDAEIEMFCDSDRVHVKEGLIIIDEENGVHYSIRTSRAAVQLFYGRTLRRDELLKVSQTALEQIITAEQQSKTDILLLEEEEEDDQEMDDGSNELIPTAHSEELRIKRTISTSSNKSSGGLSLSRINSLQSTPRRGGTSRKRLHDDIATPASTSFDLKELISGSLQAKKHRPDVDAFQASLASLGTDIDESSLTAYTGDSQLEYLEEYFQVVGLMIKSHSARMKDDMKKEGTRVNNWDVGEVKHGLRELQAKLRVLEGKIKMRLELTAAAGIPLPRLELLSQRLKLDEFERKTIVFLIGRTVSPVVRALLESLGEGSRGYVEDSSTVGQLLATLCQDFKTQIDYRKYFYKSSKLLDNGIISLNRSRWHQGAGDLTEQRMQLDRRILDWAVGLDSEINELVEGSDLYEPKVNLSQVVLPQGHLQSLLSQCLAYDEFRKFRTEKGFDDVISYGNSLVILLCGKSGTGKTMTVNALAKELGKKVLLVDFGSLSGRKESADMDADLKGKHTNIYNDFYL